MAVVTQQERKKQLKNQQKFVDGIPKIEDIIELNEIEQFSIKQRLLRRAQSTTIKLPFSDDLGQFDIEIRIMTPKEQDNLMDLYSKLADYQKLKPKEGNEEQNAELVAKGKELLNELYAVVGNLCVDPELDAEYWKSGSGFTMDVPLSIIQAAVSESQKVQKQVKKFRKN